MTYLYGLIRSDDLRRLGADVAGLGGAPVRVLRAARVGALVSDGSRRATTAKLEDVRAHDAVLQVFVDAGCTVAATRFGQSFDSDAEVVDHVNRFADTTATLLSEYAGCVEMRLLLPTAPVEEPAPVFDETPAGPGRAYLDRIKQGLTATRLDGLALRSAIGPVVRLERVEELPNGRGVAFAHLIARTDEDEYRTSVAALPALADARLVGPLAFYSFAEPAA